jgi:tetratricopeptide (TPR) repeat protein
MRSRFMLARAHYEKAQNNPKAGWEFGRAAFDLADAVEDGKERKDIADEGIAACRQAIALNPDSAAAHYYLALNLGELARAKKVGALKHLQEMESELTKALASDPKFDYSGPDRSLGMLYLEAPAFPIGIGNMNKARTHLQAAVKRNPEYPENRICLAEAYARWDEPKNLQTELKALQDGLPAARASFAGEAWAQSWQDWDRRVKKLETDLQRILSSPRADPAERGVRRR